MTRCETKCWEIGLQFEAVLHELLMNASRLREIIGGVKWALRFDNPLEVLFARHIFRRKRAVAIEHSGMQMLIDSQSSDAMAVTEVLLDAMYDQAIETAGGVEGDFRYLNLGANIGAFDVRVFQLLRAQHRSITGTAVEMNPSTCARLLLNLELNRMFSVRAINAAAWDRPGTVFVSIEDRDTGQRCAVGGDIRGYPVPLMTWRELFDIASAGDTIDLLKIDIEGAEERVVPEITAEDALKTRHLVIETHGLDIHKLVGDHLRRIGFLLASETPGPGETHVSRWEGARIATLCG